MAACSKLTRKLNDTNHYVDYLGKNVVLIGEFRKSSSASASTTHRP